MVIYKNAGFSPGEAYRVTTGEKLDQILYLQENKNYYYNIAFNSHGDFEIVFQLFQEYVDSISDSLFFKYFGQDLILLAENINPNRGRFLFSVISQSVCVANFY